MKTLVVFVPGFLCSELQQGGHIYWPPPPSFDSLQTLDKLYLDASELKPEGTLYSWTGVILRSLKKKSPDVISFAYDWRKSVEHNAGLLSKKYAEWDQIYDRFVWIAHSMGGLVVGRCMQLLAKSDHLNNVVITMGSPFGGSYFSAQALQIEGGGSIDIVKTVTSWVDAGIGSFFAGYYLFDTQSKKLTRAIRSWDGLYDLLPPTFLDSTGWANGNETMLSKITAAKIRRPDGGNLVPKGVFHVQLYSKAYYTPGPWSPGDAYSPRSMPLKAEGDDTVHVEGALTLVDQSNAVEVQSGHAEMLWSPAVFDKVAEYLPS